MTTRYRAGDIVLRRKGLVTHKGIALGDGRVLHNTPFRGEHITSEAEFRDGKRLRVARQDAASRARALRYARSDRRAHGYHLLRNNCEHTVNRASRGRSESEQLQGWLVGLGAAAVTFALTRHPGGAVAAYAAGRGVIAKLKRRR